MSVQNLVGRWEIGRSAQISCASTLTSLGVVQHGFRGGQYFTDPIRTQGLVVG